MLKPVIIVGVGALGSHTVLAARNWANPIKVIDFDRVEMKNTQAQFHTKMGMGKNKTLSMQQSFMGSWGRKLDTNTNKLITENAEALLGGAALVIDCTDNIKARHVITAYTRLRGIPCLHAALSADSWFGRIMWDSKFVPDAEDAEGQATCEDGTALPFIIMMGGLTALIAQDFLNTGVMRNLSQVSPNFMIGV